MTSRATTEVAELSRNQSSRWSEAYARIWKPLSDEVIAIFPSSCWLLRFLRWSPFLSESEAWTAELYFASPGSVETEFGSQYSSFGQCSRIDAGRTCRSPFRIGAAPTSLPMTPGIRRLAVS